MKHLFTHKGFLPYIVIVFLNAFMDLGHKIIIQNTIFKTYDGQEQVILTAIVNGLILLPFILLFSPSGYLSDRYPKQRVMRYSALFAVAATVMISLSYYMGWFWGAFALTLLLATQSAIYSPAKYGYIRELVGDENIAQANAMVQAITIIAILGGTFVFSALFELLLPAEGMTPVEIMPYMTVLGLALIVLAIVEWLFTYKLPEKYIGDNSQTFRLSNYLNGSYLVKNFLAIKGNQTIWLSIIGLSVFWAISQVILAAFPAYAKEVFNENNTVMIQGMLACTGIGIMLGSVIAGRMSRAYIELGLIPVGALGITLGLFFLPAIDSYLVLGGLFLLVGVAGGLFIIPLNALIQYSASEDRLGVVLAGNNWIQNITMLSFLVLTAMFAVAGIDSVGLFYILTITALLGSLYTIKKLPHSLARILASLIIRRRYRIDVLGFENLPKKGGVLLLGNHISWIDWAMVQIACPRPVRFVMLRSIYERWYLKPFFKFFGAVPISAGNSKTSLETVNACLKNGEVVCLFPEGAISRNGHLGQFRTGYERAVEGVDGVIVPFYLRGFWGSWLSRSRSGKLHSNTASGLRRDIIVAFGRPLSIDTKADDLKQKVFELSIDAWQLHTGRLDNVALAWLKTAKSHLAETSMIDSSGSSLSNARMIAATTAFARKIRQKSQQQNVGILLPSSSAAIIANLAVMLNGKTAVNLNYTSSAEAVKAGIANAEIKMVYTSEKFVKKLAQKGINVEAMLEQVQVINMEAVKKEITMPELLARFVMAYVLPAALIYRISGRPIDIESPAQILFSSGSEGVPKGIVLTHRNIMGNIKQISDVLNTQADDVVMASLPPFHSFGLTVTSLLPMVEGIPAVCHPDPTDALNVAKAVARYQATIMCGTATFLRLYTRNRKVDPLMFDSLRVVVAGAEKLSQDVREAFELKFKKTIYEGYGATETTPVASVNIPDKMDTSNWKPQVGQKTGTVGLPLPGSCFRIVDPETLETLPIGEDGLILISGGQVMQGYLNDAAKTEQAIVELDGRRWYRTGDKGYVDNDGFLTIVDRYSRFAKIGGEMVSLGAVEEAIKSVIDDKECDLAAASLKDDKKGEKVVVLVSEGFDTEAIRQKMVDAGVNPLMIPSMFYAVPELPKLGSGKTDFSAIRKLAETMQ